MSTECLRVQFSGQAMPLHNLLADIGPNIYTKKEALDMMNELKSYSDETDCSGRASASSDSATCVDGRISHGKFDVRVDKTRMRYEVCRIETFKTWPETNPLRPGLLARAGFYYTGVDDIVKCFSCDGEVKGWEFGDTAMGEHRRHFPNCEFAKGIDHKNVSLLQVHERPEFERRLGERIEQSQRDIERRAKEKEAMLLKEQVAAPSTSKPSSSVASSSRNSPLLEVDDKMSDDETGSSSLFGSYHKEYDRLKSFRTWPRTSPIEPRDLARAGFYYTGTDDTVQCFACFGQIGRWKPRDVPADEHRRNFPNCPFVLGLNVDNEPISGPPVFPSVLPPPLRSTSAPQPTHRQLQVGRELQRQGSAQLRAHLGPLNNCRHPVYAQEEARLRTFQHWPTNLRISATPRLLARAGFFYTGARDECKCFYCDGGLKNWERDDEPWTEHAKWFPRCEWLVRQRGESFIMHVQRVNPPPVGGSQMEFTPPTLGRDETFFDPPHVFQASYQERGLVAPPATGPVAGHVAEGREAAKGEGRTVAEEKTAAMREYRLKNKEPEAAAEVHFTKKAPSPEGKLKAEKGNSKPSLDEMMQNPTIQMVVDMGYDRRLLRYVIAERLKQTGQEFSSPDDLLEALWQAQKMDIDLEMLDRLNASPSSVATGGSSGSSDEEKSTKELELNNTSAVDIQARKLAGLSISENAGAPKMRATSPETLKSGSGGSLDDKQLCKICLDRELNTVFMPCKHLATCAECASMVTECPMCRHTILTSFQVYMP